MDGEKGIMVMRVICDELMLPGEGVTAQWECLQGIIQDIVASDSDGRHSGPGVALFSLKLHGQICSLVMVDWNHLNLRRRNGAKLPFPTFYGDLASN